MSIATAALAGPSVPRPVSTPSADWISLSEASRLTNLHSTTLLRMALQGQIRHRTRGLRTVYLAADVARAAR